MTSPPPKRSHSQAIFQVTLAPRWYSSFQPPVAMRPESTKVSLAVGKKACQNALPQVAALKLGEGPGSVPSSKSQELCGFGQATPHLPPRSWSAWQGSGLVYIPSSSRPYSTSGLTRLHTALAKLSPIKGLQNRAPPHPTAKVPSHFTHDGSKAQTQPVACPRSRRTEVANVPPSHLMLTQHSDIKVCFNGRGGPPITF